MKLKLKTAGIIGLTMGLFILSLFLFIRPYILEDAQAMDEESLVIDSERVKRYIEDERADLQQLNRDWGVWDDTYQFIQDQNEEYLSSNIMLDTFQNNEINFMLFIDTEGNMVHAEGYELDQGTPLVLEGSLPAPAELIRKTESGSAIIESQQFGTLLLASQPVLTSLEEGPVVGYLMMGKFLNAPFFEKMRNDLSVDVQRAAEAVHTEETLTIEKTAADTLTGKLLIGRESDDMVLLSIQKERKYYQEKIGSLNDLFLVLSLATALLVFLVYYLLDRFVLARVSALSLQLRDVDFEKPLTLNVHSQRTAKDEIADLEKSIQEMLNTLQKAHADVSNLAFYDQLTGLPNRFSLYKEFKERTAKAEAHFAVLFFDLDGFKRINDLYGHGCGDDVLRQVGARIMDTHAYADSRLYRIGGDEFVLLTDCTDKEKLMERVEAVKKAVQQEFFLGTVKAGISTSIGVSLFPNDGETLDELLQYADMAMYEVKRTGKNRCMFYEDLSNKHVYLHSIKLKNDLTDAVKKNQLFLEYQPIFDQSGICIKGTEALVRWNHPEEGVISPLQFIPLAEETGQIRNIGEWVIRTAVTDIHKWNLEHQQSLTVAVNVSKSQLKNPGELIDVIDRVLADTGFPANLLQIEITESDTAFESTEILSFIEQLKVRNIQVALDDFGAGTSSLFHLTELNVDLVKIDRSFLQKVPHHQEDTALLEGIYRILQELNVQVISEGVETVEQAEFAATKHGSFLQGYYFSRPVMLERLHEIQKQRQKEQIKN